jgi:hypothetical protein
MSERRSTAAIIADAVRREADEQAEQGRQEVQRGFLTNAQQFARPVDASARLSVVPTGNAIRLTDHPSPQTHSGYTLRHDQARLLADALIEGSRVRMMTFENRTLTVHPAAAGVVIRSHTQGDGQGWPLSHVDAAELGRAILLLIGEVE